MLLYLPVPGQQFEEALGRVIVQARQHVGEPGLRVDVIELGSLDQRVNRGGASAARIGTGEGPVVAPDGDAAQRACLKGLTKFGTDCPES